MKHRTTKTRSKKRTSKRNKRLSHSSSSLRFLPLPPPRQLGLLSGGKEIQNPRLTGSHENKERPTTKTRKTTTIRLPPKTQTRQIITMRKLLNGKMIA